MSPPRLAPGLTSSFSSRSLECFVVCLRRRKGTFWQQRRQRRLLGPNVVVSGRRRRGAHILKEGRKDRHLGQIQDHFPFLHCYACCGRANYLDRRPTLWDKLKYHEGVIPPPLSKLPERDPAQAVDVDRVEHGVDRGVILRLWCSFLCMRF